MSSAETIERLRRGLRRIQERSEARRPYLPSRDLTDYSKGWNDGYSTALATAWLLAEEHLNPREYKQSEERWRAGAEVDDRKWFKLTGHCGHCGNDAQDCVCGPGDSCGCGPHQVRLEPIPCSMCDGAGTLEAPAKRAWRRRMEDSPLVSPHGSGGEISP